MNPSKLRQALEEIANFQHDSYDKYAYSLHEVQGIAQDALSEDVEQPNPLSGEELNMISPSLRAEQGVEGGEGRRWTLQGAWADEHQSVQHFYGPPLNINERVEVIEVPANPQEEE